MFLSKSLLAIRKPCSNVLCPILQADNVHRVADIIINPFTLLRVLFSENLLQRFSSREDLIFLRAVLQ